MNDKELQSDVLDELNFWPNVNAAHIGVSAKEGVITLTGQVEHYTEKTAAEESAKGVYGVKGIANDIVVETPGSYKRTDQDITIAAVNALKWDFNVPKDKVKVLVKEALVTLEGTLDWQYQKDAAARCVRYLMGVSMVANNITIKSSVKSVEVKAKIEDAFRRNADLEAKHITVRIADGRVTLSGHVATWSERDEAFSAAWSAPGVSAVTNDLVIAP